MSKQPQRTGNPSRGSRPGAMTMAMQAVQQSPSGPKVLRIGLIQKGKIVEERIIRKRETVSVGSSEKNHFTVAAEGLGSKFELFQLVGNEYILNWTEGMRGRVGLPSGVEDLDELRTTNRARNAGSHFQVKLTDNSRGKVVLGDTTLLFQFVVPPPVQPRPQLPAAVVGGFIAGIDWLFNAFVMFSFMTHFGFIIYLENADWPVEPTIATVPDRLAEIIFEEPPAPPPENTEAEVTDEGDEVDEDAEQVAEAPRDSQSSGNASESSGGSGDPAAQAARNASARLAAEAAAANVQQALIGALTGEGGFADVLAGGMVTGNAEEVMAEAAGVGVADGTGGTGLTERGGGNRLASQTGDLGALQGGSGRATSERTEGQPVAEREIRGRANMGALEDERGAGFFDANEVTRQVRRRVAAVRRCYERELRNNPTLAGRVLIEFTIQPRGNLTGVRAAEDTLGSPAATACMVRAIRGIRFNPGPEGGSVSYSYPFVFAPQN